MIKIIALFALVGIQNGYAQGSGSHGGEAVQCQYGSLTTTEVLDYFEAVEEHHRQIDVPGKDWKDKVTQLIERVKTKDLGVASALKTQYDEFLQSYVTVDRAKLPIVNDSTTFIRLTPNCIQLQAAVQKAQIRVLEKRYYFDEAIWSQMDDIQKAGLVMHELLFRLEVIAAGTKDQSLKSDGVRYFNGVISSADFQLLPLVNYADLVLQSLQSNGTYFVTQAGLPVSIRSVSKDSNNSWDISNVDFYENGNSIRSGFLTNEAEKKLKVKLYSFSSFGVTQPPKLRLYFAQEGSLLYGVSIGPISIETEDGQALRCYAPSKIHFKPDFSFDRCEEN